MIKAPSSLGEWGRKGVAIERSQHLDKGQAD